MGCGIIDKGGNSRCTVPAFSELHLTHLSLQILGILVMPQPLTVTVFMLLNELLCIYNFEQSFFFNFHQFFIPLFLVLQVLWYEILRTALELKEM